MSARVFGELVSNGFSVSAASQQTVVEQFDHFKFMGMEEAYEACCHEAAHMASGHLQGRSGKMIFHAEDCFLFRLVLTAGLC